jgi:hypothetical protein
MLARPDRRAGKALVVAVGAPHQLADVGRLFEDPLLPLVRHEGLALLDAEQRDDDLRWLSGQLVVRPKLRFDRGVTREDTEFLPSGR